MSKVAKVVGTIAAIVAVAATIALTAGLAAPAFASWATIAAVAGAVSAVAGAVASATMKPPDMKGSVNSVVIGRNLPIPYAIGRTYAGGFQVYDNSAGENNKDRTQIMVLSGAGPIEAIEGLFGDYTFIALDEAPPNRISGEPTGYYEDYLWIDSRLGTRPDTALLNDPGRAPLRNWDASNKLSGFAAYRATMKFDKDGERYSSGIPQWGCVFKGPKVYDPRKDSTYPGGSGSNRWNDEASFEYGVGMAIPSAENPAIAALNYARGRYIEKTAGGAALNPPVKLLGCGFGFADIEVDQFVELANICDANGWRAGGLIYEAPGASKWDNLKRILQAGAAEPTWSGGKLGVKISAPRTPVVTIGLPDLSDGELSVQAMKSWRDKVNTVVPRVRLESHRWEYTQLDEVTSSTYLTEDGEPKSTEVQFDLVQQVDQGAELAAYTLVNGREFGPIVLPLKPAFMVYQVGEAVTVNVPELGLVNQRAIILARQIDPASGAVVFTLESETNAKHDFALGRTGVAPPSPTLIPPEEMDQTTGDLTGATALQTSLILSSSPSNLTLTIDTAGVVTISAHVRTYADRAVSVNGGTITPAPAGVWPDMIGVYYDQQSRLGGAVPYQYSRIVGGVGETGHLFASATNPYRHFVCLLQVPQTGQPPASGGSGTGPDSGGTGPPGGGYIPRGDEEWP